MGKIIHNRSRFMLIVMAVAGIGFLAVITIVSVLNEFLAVGALDFPTIECGVADTDNNGIFNYVDFDAFAKAYVHFCNDSPLAAGGCGAKDVNSDNFMNYIDFDSFAKRYYPYKSTCVIPPDDD